jgi:hypothetical protein
MSKSIKKERKVMKLMCLVFVLLVAILVSSFCLDKASASTKEEEYDELNAFFIGNDAGYEQYLRELAERPERPPQELKYVQGRLQGMQERLESNYSKLKDSLAKAEAGNYIFIDRDTSKILPDFTVTIITKQEFYDKSTEAANSPNLDKTKYIRAIDVSTKYIKEEGQRRLKQTEKLLQKTQEWKTYYLGEGPKPSEPGQSTDSTSTDNKSQVESIYQKIDAFLAENREMYAKDLNKLVSVPTANPEEIKKIIAGLEGMEKDLKDYCGKLEDYIAKAKDGNYILINLHRWPAFAPQLTATIIPKKEYIDKNSDAAFNPTPEKTNFIVATEASTEYLKKDGPRHLEEIAKLLQELKKWKSYYINQLAKTAEPKTGLSGEFSGPVWELKETLIDPDKRSGTADYNENIWTIESASGAYGTNKSSPSIKKSISVVGVAPQEIKPGDRLNFAITVACEGSDPSKSCCVYAGMGRDGSMTCKAIVDNKEVDTFSVILGECKDNFKQTLTYVCYPDKKNERLSWSDEISLSPYIEAWGKEDAPIVVYKYKQKGAAK